MSKKKNQPDTVENLEEALTRTEQFIEDHQKLISMVIGGILLVIIVYLGYNRLYLAPKEKEAQSQMYVAEKYFEKDSFDLALYGDGSYPGFVEIIDQYGMTDAGELARYYAGISFLNMDNYDQAIEYLSDFKVKDDLLMPAAIGAIGDAYVGKDDIDQALSFYQDAYKESENTLTTPLYLMKAAAIYESQGKVQKALDNYEKIKRNYPDSHQGRQVNKFIARAKVKLAQN